MCISPCQSFRIVDGTRVKQIFLALFLCFYVTAQIPGAALAAVPEVTKEIVAADLLKMIRAERGKVVVVNFFASWCPPCKEEIPDLIALRNSMKAEDLTLIGVSVDEDPRQLEAMRERFAFTYPVFRAGGDLPAVFAISSIPRLLIYDTKGTLVIDHIGIADPDALTAKINELKGN